MTDWTQPKTFSADPSKLALWNTYLRDNMEHLKAPPNEQHAPAYAATTITTTSTTFANISSDYSKTLTTYGGDLLVIFSCGDCQNACLDIALDGVRQGAVDGILQTFQSVGLYWLIQNVVAGSHTIAIQWKVISGTATISNAFMPFFNVREFS